jgi:hypothetical protein
MQTRELLVPVKIVIEGEMTVKSIDEGVRRAWRDFASQAWQAAVDHVERTAEKQNAGALRSKGGRKRTLWTTAGFVEFKRRRYFYADGREKGSFHVFDLRADLRRGRRFTPGASEMYARVVSVAPSYRKTSEIAELLTGDAPSDWAIWTRAQEEGKRLRERDAEERRRVFQGGELPGSEIAAKDFVGIEADSTMIHAWKQKGVNHEMYLGIAYDGKEKVGEKRRRLTNKVAAVGVYGPKEFGEDFFVTAQKHHNVCDAKAMLFGSDGDPVLESIRQNHFPAAPHQLDWRHVVDRTRQAYTWERIDEAKKLMGFIFSNDRDSFEKQSIFDRLRLHKRRSKIDELREYLDDRWDWMFSYRELKREHPDLPPHLNGTGAIERNIGTVVGHRMKRRGMGWTRKGAANIMRVRLEMVVPTTT